MEVLPGANPLELIGTKPSMSPSDVEGTGNLMTCWPPLGVTAPPPPGSPLAPCVGAGAMEKVTFWLLCCRTKISAVRFRAWDAWEGGRSWTFVPMRKPLARSFSLLSVVLGCLYTLARKRMFQPSLV